MIFDDTCNSLIATYSVRADGFMTALYLFDGFEITEAEYTAIQVAALDRFCGDVVEG